MPVQVVGDMSAKDVARTLSAYAQLKAPRQNKGVPKNGGRLNNLLFWPKPFEIRTHVE